MDRGAWQATVHGVTSVWHDLAAKPPPDSSCLPPPVSAHHLGFLSEWFLLLLWFPFHSEVVMISRRQSRGFLGPWFLTQSLTEVKVKVLSDSLWPNGLYSPWNSPGQNTGVVAFSFSRGSSQNRDWIQVSHIVGGLFTSWATREGQEYWRGWPIPSPADLPDPGIKPGSPALQVDSLPTELLGKPQSLSWPN